MRVKCYFANFIVKFKKFVDGEIYNLQINIVYNDFNFFTYKYKIKIITNSIT